MFRKGLTIDCTGIDIAFFLPRRQKTRRNIHLKNLTLLNADPEIRGWPWLVEVIRDAFQIMSFRMENCIGKDNRDLLKR